MMGEKIFWSAYDSPDVLTAITPDVYKEGMRQAIEETTISLKRAYDMAIQKHKNSEDYEHTLWAVADGPMLKKQVSDIFENNYLRIMDDLERVDRVTKEAFYQRLNKLKKDAHGSILIANKQGWYEFSENIIRGYVRLRAEQAGVRIGVDHIKG